MFGHGDSVLHHRYAGTVRNAHGQTVVSYADPVELHGVGVAPGASTEPRDGGSYRVVSQTTIYVPPGTTVDARDQFTVRGIKYGVEGDAAGEWRNPYTGWNPGSAVTLRRISG